MANLVKQDIVLGEAVANPAAPTVANQGTPDAKTYTYKLVARLVSGAHSAASSGGTTTTGATTLNGTNFNRLTWTDPPVVTGELFEIDIYRTASNGTPSTLGLIGTVAAGVGTFDDTGLAGDGATAPATNNADGTGTGFAISTWEKFYVYMGPFVGTWQFQISPDGIHWFNYSSSQTNSTAVACTAQGKYGRVNISAFTSGAVLGRAWGQYSADGG